MSFTKALNQINGGQTTQQLSEELASLIKSIATYGSKGSLTLKLDVVPSKEVKGAVNIKPSISTVLPKPVVSSLLYISDDKKSLQLRDPRQPEIEGLKEVDKANGVVEIGDDKEVQEVG